MRHHGVVFGERFKGVRVEGNPAFRRILLPICKARQGIGPHHAPPKPKFAISTQATNNTSPFSAGLQAARANVVPGVLIWSVMLAVVLAYYNHEPTRAALGIVADWKSRFGYGFSFVATGIAGGVLPEILKVLLLQGGKVRKENTDNIVFAFCFWGMTGCLVDAFYRQQAIWFGSEATPAVLVKKVLVDQFVFTPTMGTSLVVWAYEWRRCGFRPSALRGIFSLKFYRTRVFPALLAGWSVWIPAVSIIYSLPSLLQVPLFTLATSFWSLIVTFIAAAHKDEA